MKKAGVILVVAIVAGLGWWFGVRQPSQSAAGLTAYVPADTAVYMGGTTNPALAKLMDHYPVSTLDSGKVEQMFRRLEQRHNGPLGPGVKLMRALLKDFAENSATYGELRRHYGIATSGESAFYLHGIYPVLRLPIADTKAFNEVWNRASESSGLNPTTQTQDGVTLKRWRLSPPGSPDYADLVVAMDKGEATITLFSSLDSPQQQQVRLGLARPEHSLADSGEVRQLIKSQGFDSAFAGFIHIDRLASGLLQADQGQLSKDFGKLLKKAGKPNPFAAQLDQPCRQEVAGLFAAVPRWVIGYQDVKVDDKQAAFTASSILEIKNPELLASLQKLRGHLPGLDQQGGMLSVSLATDMDSLVPALTELWRQATTAKFTCPRLQQLQQQMAARSPAPLGVMTGMMQGVKGMGISLYDIGVPSRAGEPAKFDFLVSLATTNPELVLSLLNTTLVPRSQGRIQPLPLTGELTDVDLGFLVPGLKVRIGKEGKHLVMFSGAQAAKAAKALAKETLAPNGLMAASVDYPKMSHWMKNVPLDLLASMPNGSELCTVHAQVRNALRKQPMQVRYVTDLDAQGLTTKMWIRIEAMKPQAAIGNLSGHYDVLNLGDNCADPTPLGHEEINKDGSGRYTEVDPSGKCDLLSFDYRWTREGDRLLFNVKGGQTRDACDQQWGRIPPHQAQCEIVPRADGFDCIYTGDESKGLYRYRRLP